MGDTTAVQRLDANSKVLHEAPALIQRIQYDANGMALYIGLAAPGSATSAAVWQIRKLINDASYGPTFIGFADGNNRFDNVWNDRAGKSYS